MSVTPKLLRKARKAIKNGDEVQGYDFARAFVLSCKKDTPEREEGISLMMLASSIHMARPQKFRDPQSSARGLYQVIPSTFGYIAEGESEK